jgi:hypothetical protein
MSYAEIVAERVIDRVPILAPEDLLLLDEIVWALRGRVVEEPMKGAEAQLLFIPGGRAIITVSTLINSFQRRRFSIAHELGHLQMHREEIRINICTRQDITEAKRANQRDLEQEANVFASCFLMPTRFIKPYFYPDAGPSMEVIQRVSDQFQVSLTAAACRSIDFSSEPVAVVYLRAGKIQWFKPTQDFLDTDAFVNVGGMVGINTNASRIFKGLSVPDGWHSSRASDWLREGDFRNDAEIKEWSINMMNYESVLSLLWMNEDIYDDEDDL